MIIFSLKVCLICESVFIFQLSQQRMELANYNNAHSKACFMF
jgi:hypothetical protein